MTSQHPTPEFSLHPPLHYLSSAFSPVPSTEPIKQFPYPTWHPTWAQQYNNPEPHLPADPQHSPNLLPKHVWPNSGPHSPLMLMVKPPPPVGGFADVVAIVAVAGFVTDATEKRS
ncbi:hypothetical protein QR685DRAFT_517640 [Neurospora intermedia]|uniref:Uncharacterized protein n=1 Tax=Neurospora intermedia TaxID=5142 RepID=A0ABR3DMZ1_NEUIN